MDINLYLLPQILLCQSPSNSHNSVNGHTVKSEILLPRNLYMVLIYRLMKPLCYPQKLMSLALKKCFVSFVS